MKKFELSIPKPCHENWDAMTPEDKGRFCGACQKTVIDFIDMSDRQIAEFFKKPSGNVCGRFGGEQLNRIIEVPRKRIPWIKYFFTIALPAFLFSIKAGAQGQVRVKGKVAVCEKPVSKGDTLITPSQKSPYQDRPVMLGLVMPMPEKQISRDSIHTITGRVTDQYGNPLQQATIQLLGGQQAVLTDNNGKFSFKTKESRGTMQVSLAGFAGSQIEFNGKDEISIVLNETTREMLGEVVVVKTSRKKPQNIPLITPIKNDSTLSKFSVYPNPIERNSIFTIETKGLEDGRYNMSITTSTGEIVQTKELVIENKLKRITVQLKNISAAPYFIRLTNKTNNKAYTEIILVK